MLPPERALRVLEDFPQSHQEFSTNGSVTKADGIVGEIEASETTKSELRK
jgi:hypothetical protein